MTAKTFARPMDRLERSRGQFGPRWFGRKDYLDVHKMLSTATASRDLALGVSQEILVLEGAKPTARYRYKTRR